MPPDPGNDVRLYVFDDRGTALDDLQMGYGSVEHIFSLLGLPCPTKDQFRNEISPNSMEGFYWRRGVPRSVSAEDLEVVRKLYYQARKGRARYRPDFAPLVQDLKRRRIRVAMCSAETPEILHAFMQEAGCLELIGKAMVRGGAFPSKTPVLKALAEELNIPPHRAAYVDDTDDGISAAREAGLVTIGFNHPTSYNSSLRIHAAKPSHVVSDFKELKALSYRLSV
jgi:phosphoglycolate phosphatase-like HAD superfamily hydrolase